MKNKAWLAWLIIPVALLGAGVWVKLDPNVNISRTEMIAQAKYYLGELRTELVKLPPLAKLAHHIKQNATSTISVNTDSYSTTSGTNTSSTATSTSSTSSSSSSTTDATQTPIESIVQGVQLANTYYYHFSSATPTSVRQVFKEAVAKYNATGIVQIKEGRGTKLQNRITFSVYHKQMSAAERGTVELGKGGPEIIKTVSGDGTVQAIVNHAHARLNITYSDSISLAVAMHELGHAVGLDHSDEKNSIMYPVDQGVTTLSAADLAALKAIYQQQ